MPEFNSHLDFFELLSLIRCGRNSAYETGLTYLGNILHSIQEAILLNKSHSLEADDCRSNNAFRLQDIKLFRCVH